MIGSSIACVLSSILKCEKAAPNKSNATPAHAQSFNRFFIGDKITKMAANLATPKKLLNIQETPNAI